jgi:hypothetical protein
MRVKLLTATILIGFQNPLPSGAVVESDEAHKVREFESLIAVNYAKETTQPVTHHADGSKPVEPVLVKDDDAPPFESQPGDIDLLGILEGTVGEVGEFISELAEGELARLAVLEARGRNRKGVLEAITAAQEG